MSVSILILSCSLYKNIWGPFFYLFNKYWEDCPFTIYLGTDKYTHYEDYKDFNINILITDIEPYSNNYTSRVYDHLQKINDDYIILLQDDFLLTEMVHTKQILECINILKNNNLYNGIRLHGAGEDCGFGNKHFNISNNIVLSNHSQRQKYWFSWMATLWNRKKLIDILKLYVNTNTEDSEKNITNYMKQKKKQMLSISSRKKINIINYLGIGAINGGALNKNYIPYLKKKNIPHVLLYRKKIYL